MRVELKGAPEALGVQSLWDAFTDEAVAEHLTARFMQPRQAHFTAACSRQQLSVCTMQCTEAFKDCQSLARIA